MLRIISPLFLSFLLLGSLSSCSNLSSQKSRNDEQSSEELSAENLIEHITISPKPDRLALNNAHVERKDIIIDMRSPSEIQGDVDSLAHEYGFTYYNIPFFNEDNEINKKSIDMVGDLASKNPGKVVVHCSSGNRASAWLSLYLHQKHNWQVDRAIKAGEKKKLTKRKLKQLIRDYVENSP